MTYNFRRNQIIIQNRPDWTTKSRKPRVIPMHPATHEILSSLSKDHEYVFSTREGETIDSYIRQEIDRYAKKAKVHASVKMFRLHLRKQFGNERRGHLCGFEASRPP